MICKDNWFYYFCLYVWCKKLDVLLLKNFQNRTTCVKSIIFTIRKLVLTTVFIPPYAAGFELPASTLCRYGTGGRQFYPAVVDFRFSFGKRPSYGKLPTLSQYAILSSRLDEAEGVMQRLQQRDDNIYRVMMQADPLPDEQRSATANNARYNELMDMANSRLVIHTLQKMDGLEKKIYAQSKSFDEVVGLCKQHDKMLPAFPPSSRFQTRI